MLKKLYIENFQSHSNTTIQFSNGLNIFQGQSNGGKSSIIRAISAVCYNKWSNESIRIGCEQTTIILQTDLGVVKLVKNPTKKINAYYCKKNNEDKQQYFQSIGTTVPQIVYEITGMRQLVVGDSISDIPNIMYQLQKHYMLAQVSGKNCTSNVIARIFDKVIGLGGMQQLINQISSNMLTNKKNITKNMAKSDQLKFNLVDQDVIRIKQEKLNNIKILKNDLNELHQKLNLCNQILDNYNIQKNRLNNVNEKYINIDTKKASNYIHKLLKNGQSYKNLIQFITINNKLNRDVNIIESNLNNVPNVDKEEIDFLKKICNKLFIAQKILKKIDQKKSDLKISNQIIDKNKRIDECISEIEVLKNSCNKFFKLNKYLEKNIQKTILLQKTIQNLKEYEVLISTTTKKLINIKKQCQICPLCGNKFEQCDGVKC